MHPRMHPRTVFMCRTVDFDALGECDMIIEAAVENMDSKEKVPTAAPPCRGTAAARRIHDSSVGLTDAVPPDVMSPHIHPRH